MSRKGWIFDRRGGWLSGHIVEKVALASTVHERTTLVTLVSYKDNVAAKHGSSKPLTSNELWLLKLWIKSTPILASIPDALWDVCKSFIAVVWGNFVVVKFELSCVCYLHEIWFPSVISYMNCAMILSTILGMNWCITYFSFSVQSVKILSFSSG